MLVLVTYDVSFKEAGGEARLRRIAKVCLDYGVRVQYSVFECDLLPDQWIVLKSKLLTIFDENQDSLRFYYLGTHWRNRVEHHGSKQSADVFVDPLIV